MCAKNFEKYVDWFSDLWTLRQIDMTRAEVYISDPGLIWLAIDKHLSQ